MEIIKRVKTFFWCFMLAILLFVGIFIPIIYKWANEGAIEVIRKYKKEI